MRIRKRSVDALSKSSSSWAAKSESFEEPRGRDFLLPLVVAAMNVQAEAETEAAPPEDDAAWAPRSSETASRKQWRTVLLPFSTNSEAEKAGGEGHNPNYKWDGIMSTFDIQTTDLYPLCISLYSRNGSHKSIDLTSGDRVKEEKSSSVDRQISGLRSERELPKPGGIQKFFVSVGDLTVKKKRSKKNHAIRYDGAKYYNAGRKEDDIDLNTNQTALKPTRSGDINHGGSQCKRRNGRGWRCSQRTLVGYSLCEHHLGKSRFKNINAGNSAVTVAVNNKGIGSKYKQLHLINAALM